MKLKAFLSQQGNDYRITIQATECSHSWRSEVVNGFRESVKRWYEGIICVEPLAVTADKRYYFFKSQDVVDRTIPLFLFENLFFVPKTIKPSDIDAVCRKLDEIKWESEKTLFPSVEIFHSDFLDSLYE